MRLFNRAALIYITVGAAVVIWTGVSARRADLPPEGVTLAMANPEPIAVAPTFVEAPANSTAASVAPDGQVMFSPPKTTGLTQGARGVPPRNFQ